MYLLKNEIHQRRYIEIRLLSRELDDRILRSESRVIGINKHPIREERLICNLVKRVKAAETRRRCPECLYGANGESLV